MNSSESSTQNEPPPRRGAVAVVVREDRFLTIRRAEGVLAPRAICFPGGGLEGEETEEQALAREMIEELNVVVRPVRLLWRYRTRWNVDLAWWLAELDERAVITPNPLEVAEVHWLTAVELLACSELLQSNRAFFAALENSEFLLEPPATYRQTGD